MKWSVCEKKDIEKQVIQSVSSISSTISTLVNILAGLLILLHIFTMIFYYLHKENKLLKRASLDYLVLSLIFSSISLIGAVLFMYEPSETRLGRRLCIGRTWTLGLGLVGLFSSLLVKSYRLDKIFSVERN